MTGRDFKAKTVGGMTQSFWLTRTKEEHGKELASGAMLVPLLMLLLAVIVTLSMDINVYEVALRAACDSARHLGLATCAADLGFRPSSLVTLGGLRNASTLAGSSTLNKGSTTAKKRRPQRKLGNAPGLPSSPTTLLSSDPKLAAKLQQRLGLLLPPGMGVNEAARGFKNLGQFIAAAHAAHNLGISFLDLKAKMVSGASLDEAIRELKPGVNPEDEARHADKQAGDDLSAAGTESEADGKG